MNPNARTAFRHAEIQSTNQDAADARSQVRSDFRRREITEMNSSAGAPKWMTPAVLIGVLMFLFFKPRSKR